MWDFNVHLKMVVGGNENLVFGFEKEGGRSSGVITTRLGNDGNNLPKSNSKFTPSACNLSSFQEKEKYYKTK